MQRLPSAEQDSSPPPARWMEGPQPLLQGDAGTGDGVSSSCCGPHCPEVPSTNEPGWYWAESTELPSLGVLGVSLSPRGCLGSWDRSL